MKTRNGFVSNSSSSSFTCDVCGITEETYDGGGESGDWFSCQDGHTFCEKHKVNLTVPAEEMREVLIEAAKENFVVKEFTDEVLRIEELSDADLSDEYTEHMTEDSSEVPPEQCPVCSFRNLLYDDTLKYMLASQGKTLKEVREKISAEFPNRTQFEQFIKDIRV